MKLSWSETFFEDYEVPGEVIERGWDNGSECIETRTKKLR